MERDDLRCKLAVRSRYWHGFIITNLIVFDGEVLVLPAFLVRDLHEEAAYECASDIDVEARVGRLFERVSLSTVRQSIAATDINRHDIQIESFHRPLELGADVICLSQCSSRQVIIPSPVLVVFIWVYFSGVTRGTR